MVQFIIKKHEKINTQNLAEITLNEQNHDTFKVNDGEHYYGKINGANGRSLIIKIKLSQKAVNGHIKLSREQIEYLNMVEDQTIHVQRLYEEFILASAMIFKAYDPEFEETGCATNIELKSGVTFGDGLNEAIASYLINQVLYKGQKVLVKYKKNTIMLIVVEVLVGNPGQSSGFGKVVDATTVIVEKFAQNDCFRPGVDLDNMTRELEGGDVDAMEGIISDLVYSVFRYKFLPVDIQNGLQIKPVKGVLLYGPPGMAKTQIVRNLSQIILSVKPEVVNGADLMDPYIGNTMKNVKDLFTPAMIDHQRYGDSAPLHVIILNDFELIAPKKGSGPDHVYRNAVVNEVLRKVDGIMRIPNILILATTDRIDLIDPAALRPGRIEKTVFVNFQEM